MIHERLQLGIACGLLAFVAGCSSEPPRPEWVERLAPAGAVALVTHGRDARLAETVTLPHTRRICVPETSLTTAATELALGIATPAQGVQASLDAGDEDVPGVAVGAAWTDLRAPVRARSDGCLRLSVDGPPGDTASVARATASHAGPRRPWVVLYVFDTLRFDQIVDADGSIRPVPGFRELAGDALVFLRAFSPSSWTRPSVASLLSGVEVTSHGVSGLADRMRADLPRLAAEMAAAGYRTAAVSTNPNVLPQWGFAPGFDRFVDVLVHPGDPGSVYQGLEEAVRGIIADAVDAPLFVFVHDNGPHSPYWAPRRLEVDVPPRPQGSSAESDPAKQERSEAAWRRYTAAVHASSERLADLLQSLREIRRYDDAVIVVVGDHGEAFDEHGRDGHANTLYQEQIHVPLFVKAPGKEAAAGRIDTPASLADVAPTILTLLDLPLPLLWEGRALPLDATVGDDSARVVVSELDTLWGSARTVIRWPWKYMHRRGAEELFDLQTDPGELTDVADQYPAIVAELRSTLETRRRPTGDTVVLECIAGREDARVDAMIVYGDQRPPPVLESVSLEPDDDAVAGARGVTIGLELPSRAASIGMARVARDRDQIRLMGITRVRLGVRSASKSSARLSLEGPSGEPLPTDGTGIDLDDVTTDIELPRLRAGRAPFCRLHRVKGRSKADRESIPEELKERLRALGYV